MIQETINPFPSFSKDIPQGLNTIILALSSIPHPTLNDVNTALINFISGASIFAYTSTHLDEIELNAYFPSAINAYINNDINGFTPGQAPFINLLLNKIKDVPPLQIDDFIADVEDQISKAGLSLQEENQLYMATAVAVACNDY